jgi:hypothetical protein
MTRTLAPKYASHSGVPSKIEIVPNSPSSGSEKIARSFALIPLRVDNRRNSHSCSPKHAAIAAANTPATTPARAILRKLFSSVCWS